MKRFVSRLLSLMLVASMFLTGCSLLSPETLLSGDYQQDTIYVIDNLSSAITLPDDDPNKVENQASAGALISEYVSRYRRKPQLAGSASFMTMATALNGLAGHYNSYPNRPLPQRLKDRLEQEFKQAKIALKRESAAWHSPRWRNLCMFGLGWLEVGLIALAAVLLFGPKKLPELGASLGKSLRGFKDELQDNSEEDSTED